MQTILVIDDDESLRDTIGVMLEQDGFRAVQAGDGREGFEIALSLKPDLVLVDLRLPRMSGTEICKQLRASGMATPIIGLHPWSGQTQRVPRLPRRRPCRRSSKNAGTNTSMAGGGAHWATRSTVLWIRRAICAALH